MDYKIYQKSPKEIEEEESGYRFAASLLKTGAWEACPTYIYDKYGKKRDTWSLSVAELYDICMRTGSFEILEYRNDGHHSQYERQYIRDYTTLKELLKKEAQLTDPKLRSLSKDFIGSVDNDGLLGKARTIASYKSDIEGVECTPEQIVAAYARSEQEKEGQTK